LPMKFKGMACLPSDEGATGAGKNVRLRH